MKDDAWANLDRVDVEEKGLRKGNSSKKLAIGAKSEVLETPGVISEDASDRRFCGGRWWRIAHDRLNGHNGLHCRRRSSCRGDETQRDHRG